MSLRIPTDVELRRGARSAGPDSVVGVRCLVDRITQCSSEFGSNDIDRFSFAAFESLVHAVMTATATELEVNAEA